MNQRKDFFVFISRGSTVRGLSLLRSGENLPRLIDNAAWAPFVVASLTLDNLRRHSRDPELALLNLKTKGFHIARLTAQVLPFRQRARRSA
jgi:hypothetical protein